jgi:uncharacterized membrane protein YvbJ
MKRCLKCQQQYPDADPACPQCGSSSFMNEAAAGALAQMAAGGGERVPNQRRKTPSAKEALNWAILGFFVCGVIIGPIAVLKALDAKRAMAADPRLRDDRTMANVAIALGIADAVVFVLVVLARTVFVSGRR